MERPDLPARLVAERLVLRASPQPHLKTPEAKAKELAAIDPMAAGSSKTTDGPSRQALEHGRFEIHFHAQHAKHGRLSISASGEYEPAYTGTARIMVETALCLLQDGLTVSAGFWTPVALLGDDLVRCLSRHAGLTIKQI